MAELIPDLPNENDTLQNCIGFAAIKQRSIKIPDEIGVIGFSNEEFSTQAIATIDQFSEALGSTVSRLLINPISVGREKKLSLSNEFRPQLILLESSTRK
jgi:LacI family transcriptional regulator